MDQASVDQVINLCGPPPPKVEEAIHWHSTLALENLKLDIKLKEIDLERKKEELEVFKQHKYLNYILKQQEYMKNKLELEIKKREAEIENPKKQICPNLKNI